MKYAKNILETIGNTPMVRINELAKEIPALVLAKYETFKAILSFTEFPGLKVS